MATNTERERSSSTESATSVSAYVGQDSDSPGSYNSSVESVEDCAEDEWKKQGWDLFSAQAEFERYVLIHSYVDLPPFNCFSSQ